VKIFGLRGLLKARESLWRGRARKEKERRRERGGEGKEEREQGRGIGEEQSDRSRAALVKPDEEMTAGERQAEVEPAGYRGRSRGAEAGESGGCGHRARAGLRAAHRARGEVAHQVGASDDMGHPSCARSGAEAPRIRAGDSDSQPSRIHPSSRSPRSPVQSSIRPSLDFFLLALARPRAR
jgi:hypothetical protein